MKSPHTAYSGPNSGRGSQDMGIVAKNDGNSCRAGFGGGRIVKLGSIPSLDRFQAQAIWEMSANEIDEVNQK